MYRRQHRYRYRRYWRSRYSRVEQLTTGLNVFAVSCARSKSKRGKIMFVWSKHHSCEILQDTTLLYEMCIIQKPGVDVRYWLSKALPNQARAEPHPSSATASQRAACRPCAIGVAVSVSSLQSHGRASRNDHFGEKALLLYAKGHEDSRLRNAPCGV